MRQAILIATVLCSFGAEAHGGEYSPAYYTGNELYKFCQAPTKSPYGQFCLGFTAAAATAYSDESCLRGVQIGQVVEAITIWLRDHPEKRHLEGSFLVGQALKEKFSCN